jgi:uncharacterized protein (DUF169 family)
MEKYSHAEKVIQATVGIGSKPLGLCLVSQDADWPDHVLSPSDRGMQSSLCQWTNFSRRQGVAVGLKVKDIVCAPCLAAFGFKRMSGPEVYARFLESAGYASCEKTALTMAAQLPLLPAGRYQGVLAFPLGSAVRKPDTVWVYGSPGQISHMVTGLAHQTGQHVNASIGIGLSCRAGFSDEPCVVVPGRGERVVAGTDEFEMFLALPVSFLDDLVKGLLALRKKGITGPFAGPMPYAMTLFPALENMAEELTDP